MTEYRLNPLAIDHENVVQVQVAPDGFVEVERHLVELLRAAFGSQRSVRSAAALSTALGNALGVEDATRLVERLARNRIVLPAEIDLPAFVEATLRPLHIATGVVAERASFARSKAESRVAKPHVPEAVRRRSFLYANGLKPERAGIFSGWLIAATRLGCGVAMSVEGGRLELVVESPSGARRRFGKFRWIEEADPRAEMVTENKRDSNYMMHLAGLPVAEQATVDFRDLRALRAFGAAVGYPLVIKPALGHDGVDVYPGLESADEVERIALEIRERWEERGGLIAEKHIAGSNYRIVVIGSQILGAYAASAVVLEGDGSSTIREERARPEASGRSRRGAPQGGRPTRRRRARRRPGVRERRARDPGDRRGPASARRRHVEGRPGGGRGRAGSPARGARGPRGSLRARAAKKRKARCKPF